MTEITFGQQVMVCAEMVKRKGSPYRKTTWTRTPYRQPKRMLYLGKRVVKEGETDSDLADGGGYISWFVPKKHINVLLCIENEHRNPVYIHPDDVSPLPDEPTVCSTQESE